jgi:adenylate cyclase
LSNAIAAIVENNGVIEPSEQRNLSPPFALIVGDRTFDVAAPSEDAMVSLVNATMAPGRQKPPSTQIRTISAMRDDVADGHGENLVEWLQEAMFVFQSAASSPDFLERAAQAVVNLVGLDTAAVLIWEQGQWKQETVCTRRGTVSANWQPSMTILDASREQKHTFRRAPKQQNAASLMGVEALVAAPILNPQGEVIGAIYGDRRQPPPDGNSVDITQLEAMLVALLASGVSAGMARMDQERAALAERVRFEQFFMPELARQLELQPDLLEGKDASISALFCDVRGFSRLSEKLGPVRTFAWISDVMEELSECVQRFEGVLVDYIGDELIAMWGAPVERPDHAALACQAAVEMIAKLHSLSQRWIDELGEEISVGVGISSGIARVGNTGSKRKFKYGPLGNTVNLASRVQGATKHLKSSILITGDTVDQLGPEIERRRLARVRVVNIEAPVDLYELAANAAADWCQLRDRYEEALGFLERSEFLMATKCLGNLVAEYPSDGPTQLLLSRAVDALIAPDEFDFVWELDSK